MREMTNAGQDLLAARNRIAELKQVTAIFLEALEALDGCGAVMLTPELRAYMTTARGLLYAPKLRAHVRRAQG